MSANKTNKIYLPPPTLTGGIKLEEVISQRRSVRYFAPDSILLFQISQILWAAQGITDIDNNLRAVPSAGGTYPLEIYLVVGENGIEQVDPGVYHYEAENHALSFHLSDDLRLDLSHASLNQDAIAVAPVSLIICADSNRTLMQYSARGERYIHMEVGHASQNIYLQATALGLGTVAIGAFRDDEVRQLLQLDVKLKPLYIMPVGKPAHI